MKTSVNTVLFVDDEAYIRQSFADYFEDKLWLTLQAESGEKGLDILEDESPQCAVVDIRMGGMDGNTFIRKALKKRPGLIFVICTGSPEYDIPEDLNSHPNVSEQLFRKPVTQMALLERELLKLLNKF